MRRIIWSIRARKDVAQIDQYLSAHDPHAAVRTLTAIRTRAMMLADFPRMGPSFDGEIRRLSIMRTNYILFYASRENDIEVLSIRHVRENWSVMGEDS